MTLTGPVRRLAVAAVVLPILAAGGIAAAATAGHIAPKGRVTGTVTAGPACPVERVDQSCPPRPVSGAAVALLRSDGSVAVGTHTDADGHYRLTATPGRYVVRATNIGGYRSEASRSVTLRKDRTATVDLSVDSGIR